MKSISQSPFRAQEVCSPAGPIIPIKPKVRVTLEHMPSGRYWAMVEPCPYCQQQHRHGAGQRGEDPRVYLFPRPAYCAAQFVNGFLSPGYALVEAPGGVQ